MTLSYDSLLYPDNDRHTNTNIITDYIYSHSP